MGVVFERMEKPLKLKFIYAKITRIYIHNFLTMGSLKKEDECERQRPKMPMLRMPFFSMEFIFRHDDIYQKFYWYLRLSDGFWIFSPRVCWEWENRHYGHYAQSAFSNPKNFSASLSSNCFYRQIRLNYIARPLLCQKSIFYIHNLFSRTKIIIEYSKRIRFYVFKLQTLEPLHI